MYCPICRDEFRPGFSRCRACDAQLVESLTGGVSTEVAEVAVRHEAPVAQPRTARSTHETFVNFCGFLALDDARSAKAQLAEHEIPVEIVIKDSSDGREEFWLRVKPSDLRATQDVLGYDESSLHEGDNVLCSACEMLVPAEGGRCSNCGTPFEED